MNYFVLSFLLSTLLCVLSAGGREGICEMEGRVSRNEVEYYTENQRCYYYESCWTRVVRKTRMRIVFDTHVDPFCCPEYRQTSPYFDGFCEPIFHDPCVLIVFDKKVDSFCCPGYRQTSPGVFSWELLECEPICLDLCVHGTCVAPGQCECSPGYGKKDSVCKPLCEPECVNADCLLGNQCTCYQGFDKVTAHSCSPHCTHGCASGYCDKPEVCACNASYSLSPNGTACLPICTLECENGTCVAPDRCECDDGYVNGEMRWNVCEPYCAEPCENAHCTSPGVCTCFTGYNQLSDGDAHKCVPHCSMECINGECIAPEECGCDEGFDMDVEKELCVPVCSNGCDNGKCVSPEKCVCDYGYRDLNGSCVPHCDIECINGNCTAPNECTCNNGTLKASTYHCLTTCDSSANDQCFHESVVALPAALISLEDDEPYVDFPANVSLQVPCNHLSAYRGVFQTYYQCYTYLNFEAPLTAVCSLDSETMAAADSNNQLRNATWMVNATSEEQGGMNVLFVHRDVSRYCTTYLCSDSNRTLYLNAISTISVCMEREAEDRTTDKRTSSWTLILISCASCVLLLALVIPWARRHWNNCEKVSYTVNTRNHSTSSRCGILEAAVSSEHVEYEHVELSNEDAP